MLKIYTEKGYQPITNRTNFNILYDYEGEQTLSFDISTNDTLFKLFIEENSIKYKDNIFTIKKINKRKKVATIECSINMSDWKNRFYQAFHTEFKLFSEALLTILPYGWEIEEHGSVDGRRTMTLEGVTDYDILMHCKSLYNIVYEFHVAEKRIKVIKPDTYQSRGLFMSDELNLRDVEFKGDSSSLVTRLYAFGKKTETRDEEGNVTNVSYVSFATINDGKPYVDNNEYSKEIISMYWQDDRYTDQQSLLNDSIDKLKQLAIPERAYSCKLLDYSRTNEKYKMLDFKLYDKATLMDSLNKTCVQHQIVQYKEFPDNENLNEVTLSNVFKSIVETIDNIKQTVSTIDTETKRTETQINEIIRDVISNTLRIENTYTKGEINIIEQSIIQQTSTDLDIAISKKDGEYKKVFEDINISIEGLKQSITTTGGNNIFEDTMGVFNNRFSVDGNVWDGSFNIDSSPDVKNRNIYGYALLLKNSNLKQTQRVPNGTYTVSFLYCKHIALANVKVIVNSVEITLDNDSYTKVETIIEVESNSLNIEFICDTDNACTICNLMGNQGSSSTVWSLAPGESWNDYVKIGRGIEIGDEQGDVTFNANARIIGFKNKSGEYVAVFTDVGAKMKEIEVTDRAVICGTLIQQIGGQTVFNKVR